MRTKLKTVSTTGRPKLKWHHFFIAAITAYLMILIANGLSGVILHILLEEPYGFCWPFELEDFLFLCIPAAINYLILRPFLRSPIEFRTAAIMMLIGWIILIIILSNFRAATR